MRALSCDRCPKWKQKCPYKSAILDFSEDRSLSYTILLEIVLHTIFWQKSVAKNMADFHAKWRQIDATGSSWPWDCRWSRLIWACYDFAPPWFLQIFFAFCKYFLYFSIFCFFSFNLSYFLKMELSYSLYSHRKIFKNRKCGNKRWDLKPVLLSKQNYVFLFTKFYEKNSSKSSRNMAWW